MEEEKSLRDIESSLNSDPSSGKDSNVGFIEEKKVSSEEEISFHKGALTTLVNERNELIKMVSNVEKVMQMHIKRLKELGVELK